MKNTETRKPLKEPPASDHGDLKALEQKLDYFEQERNILLALSNDLTMVREKNDLIKIFSSRLKGFFYFTHVVISLIDHEKKIYFPFLMDAQAHPIKDKVEFDSVLTKQYSFSDPAFRQFLNSDVPVSYVLDEIMNRPGMPSFIKLNYEYGVRKTLITPLKSKSETFGFIFIYSDDTDSFPDNFKSILQGIAPQLSNAVSNIIINDSIRHKEYTNQTLLSLSNDMVTVRDKSDLLNVINFGLKKLIYFTHSVMTVSGDSGETYQAFLTDPDSRARKFPEYAEMILQPVPVADGIYNVAAQSYRPVIFDMRSFDLDKAPLWFKLNYEAGAKEMIMSVLPGEGMPKHSIILFSDKENNFDKECISIIERISSQLATAANNISANELIINKEKDKSFLLTFSHDLAAARTRNELSTVIHQSLKKLSEVKAYFIRTINDDGATMSPFMHDNDVFYRDVPEFRKLLETKIPLNTGITGSVMQGTHPVLIDFAEEINNGRTDHYIEFWKTLGPRKAAFQKMIGTPLCVADVKLGILWVITDKINMTILDGICAQLSVAIANVQSNEEIVNKNKEQSYLLEFSKDMAAVRSKEELYEAVQLAIKKLSSVKGYVIRLINDDGITVSPYIWDRTIVFKDDPEFKKLASQKLKISDGFHDKILNSDDPVFFNINEEAMREDAPQYVRFWKRVGFLKMTGTALHTGNTRFGVLWMETDEVNVAILKGICAQISVAISNIRANEEIARREEEKSILLSLSDEIAALRNRNNLLQIVNTKLKVLFAVDEFGIAQINEEDQTHSAFVLELDDKTTGHKNFKAITSARYSVSDRLFSTIMKSEDPVLFDVNKLVEEPGVPEYVGFWQSVGVRYIQATALRVGGRNIGCVFLHVKNKEKIQINTGLIKGVCAQLAVAVSNILANEEIERREEEKSVLLAISDEIAELKSRSDLLNVVNKKLKVLFSIENFGLLQVDDGGTTYSRFIFDHGNYIKIQNEYEEVSSRKNKITDLVFTSMMNSEDPVIFDVNRLVNEPGIPPYVTFWKKIGLREVLGTALRVGGKNIGCAFIHIDANPELKKKTNLLKAIFAQLSVAVSNILANEKLFAYRKQLEVENDYLKEQIKTIYNFSEIIGSGAEMQEVYRMMSLVAESNSTVLLLGETGTGKELIARAIHNASTRKNKLMIKVNCAALPANLIESELFGHERGSFTGAIDRRIGKFELANNSTLFLDEIGEMPLETQVKLLRVIQERELERVGGTTTIKVNVRIIAATNRNLQEEVDAGRFRSDLFYRLNVFPITLPPLRNRLEDIAPLANFFLERYTKNTGKKITAISANAIKELKGYMWPGNVRELEHLIERSILLTQDTVLREIQLPQKDKERKNDQPESSHKTLHDIERSYIIEILKKYNGKIAGSDGAAHFLEIPSTTLHSKMKKLRISKADYFQKKS